LSFSTLSVDHADGNCIPFGCYEVSRYQQVYDASIFASASGPIWINRVSFFNDVYGMADGLPLQQANYQVSLTTTDRLVNDLTTNLASNINGSYVTLFNGILSETLDRGDGLEFISSTSALQYDPFGGQNLLLDIIITADPDLGSLPDFPNHFDVSRTLYFESREEHSFYGSVPTGAEDISRAYAVDDYWDVLEDEDGDGSLEWVTYDPDQYADNHGLVTEFGTTTFSPTVVPEPTTIGLVATGLIGIAGAARRRKKQSIEDC
jgi:hypothetical protein